MIIVGGRNEYNQLGENPNNTDFDGEPIISPAVKSHLDISTLLSYSVYSSHFVFITKNKKAYAYGFNSGNKISSTIPTGKLDKCTEIRILDNKGRPCNFLSAVCGTYYTLYLISPQYDNKFNKLAFVYQGDDFGRPLFLNTGNLNPISIFGGRQNACCNQFRRISIIPNTTDVSSKSRKSHLYWLL